MEILSAAELLAALGHESRLSIYRALVEAGPQGLHAGAIGERLGLPGPTLSFHFAHLSRVGLVRRRHEGRFVIYAADFPVMNDLLGFLTDNCCGGNPCVSSSGASTLGDERLRQARNHPTGGRRTPMKGTPYNVLFLCTGNSARSVLAESILNHAGQGRFRAFSAGSHPAGQVNPLALELLSEQTFPVDGLRSKSWDEFATEEAPRMDFVFTVCDKAAGEVCPVWPGQPMTAHWGIPDPAAVRGTELEARKAMADAFRQLSRRISLFVSLPLDKLDAIAIRREIRAIGSLDDANTSASTTQLLS